MRTSVILAAVLLVVGIVGAAAPIVQNLSISGYLPDDDLTLNWNSSDADGDPVRNFTTWKVNGKDYELLYIPFEGSGNPYNATDYAGFNNNATGIVGYAVFVPAGGHDGYGAYYFGLNDSYLQLNTTGFPQIGIGPYAFEAWIKTESSEAYNCIFSIGYQNPAFYTTGGNMLMVYNSFQNTSSAYNSSIADGNWHHVAFVRYNTSAGGLRFFLDGQPLGSGTEDVQVYSPAALLVGFDGYSGHDFNGTIDDIRIYNKSLSPEQVMAHYEGKTNVIKASQTSLSERWSGCVTPNDGTQDGAQNCSANVTISEGTLITSCMDITSGGTYSLNNVLRGADQPAGAGFACLDARASDVIIECNGYGMENDGTSGTTYGILINGSAKGTRLQNCTGFMNYTYGVYVYRSNGTSLDPTYFCNGANGIAVNQSNNTLINDSVVCNNTAIGIDVSDSFNTTIGSTTFYNNTKDLHVSNAFGSAADINISQAVFDNPSGGLVNYTKLWLDDSVSPGSSYSVSWSAEPFPPPAGNASFEGKYIDITVLSGSVLIDRTVWSWLQPEVSNYNESSFAIFKYNASGWSDTGAALNTSANTLTLAGYNPASVYGILRSNVTLPCVAPGKPSTYGTSIVGINGSYYVNNNTVLCEGIYTNNKTMFILNASNIYLDCAGSELRGCNTTNCHGVDFNGNDYCEVRNCVIRSFDRGVSLYSTGFATAANYNNITNNTFECDAPGADSAPYLYNAHNNTVRDNVARNCYYGFYMFNGTNNTFINNLAIGGLEGFRVAAYPTNAFYNYYFNSTSINASSYGFEIYGSSGGRTTRVEMHDTNVSNTYYCIYDGGGYSGRYYNTTLRNCTGYGIRTVSYSTNPIYQNTTVSGSQYGLYVDRTLNATFIDTHTYNNSNDVYLSSVASYVYHFTNLTIDNPSGDGTDSTRLDFNDTITSTAYTLNWSASPAEPPPGLTSFGQKFVWMYGYGSPIESIAWRWDDSEVGAYNESTFKLYGYNTSDGWAPMNATLNTTANTLTAAPLNFLQPSFYSYKVFAILAESSATDVSGCMEITSGGVYELGADLQGANISASPYDGLACVKIASSDVTLDCMGRSITNNNTGGTTHGILVNGSAAGSYSGILLRNCPSVSGYSYGAYAGYSIIGVMNSTAHGNGHNLFVNTSNATVSDILMRNATSEDLFAGNDGPGDTTINVSRAIFDNPAGGLANFTNLSLDDTIAPGSAFSASWASEPDTPPADAASFSQTYVNISAISGTVSIDRAVWHWAGNPENESGFVLYEYNSSGWAPLNNTPNATANTLTLFGFAPSSVYGIMINLTAPAIPMPPYAYNVQISGGTIGENLTLAWDSYDPDNDTVRNFTTWNVNGSRLEALYIAFEGSGNPYNATDYAGFDNNGTYATPGSIFLPSGGFDGFGAYDFSGNNDYVALDTTNFPAFGTGDYTLEAWIKTTCTRAYCAIFGINSYSPGFYVSNGDRLLVYSGGDIISDTNSSISDGNWHHVAFVRYNTSAGGLRFFLDGQPLGSGFHNQGPSSISSIWIGSDGLAGESFNGTIDDFRFYNVSLSPEQVKAHYENRTDVIVSQKLALGQSWSGCVTPNDGTQDGAQNCSATVTISTAGPAKVGGCRPVSAPGEYVLNASLSGANVSAGSGLACILIDSSDVSLDCNAKTISNNGTAGTTFGIIVSGAGRNVSLRNCSKVEQYTYGVYVNGSNGTGVDPSYFCNNVNGITVNLSNNTVIEDSVACNNTGNGIEVTDALNTTIRNSSLYNNGRDIMVGNSLATPANLNLSNVIFDRPSDNLTNHTNITMDDSVSPGSSYYMNWSAQPDAPPGNRTSFGGKYLDIGRISGDVSLDRIVWSWLVSELPGYQEARFELWKSNASGWTMVNGTQSGHTLSLYNHEPASVYGIMERNLLLTLTDCAVITDSGVYTLANNVSGAPNSPSPLSGTACMVIKASNVTLDCAGYSINHSKAYSTYGIVTPASIRNVTVKNCAIRGYADGIWFYSSPYSRITNNSLDDSIYAVIYVDSPSDYVNITGNRIGGNAATAYGVELYNSWYDILEGNRIDATSSAIYTYNSHYNIIRNNAITNTRLTGSGYGVELERAFDNNVSNNTISGWGYGLYIHGEALDDNFWDNTIAGNDIGAYLHDASTSFTRDHFYNNTIAMDMSTIASFSRLFTLANVILDSSSGTYAGLSNISLSDMVDPSSGYSLNWSAQPAGPLPVGRIPFLNRYSDISYGSGTNTIDSATWHWRADEVGAFKESMLELWKYNATSNWTLQNATLDTGAHTLTLLNFTPLSIYALLHNGTTGTQVALYGMNITNVTDIPRYNVTAPGNDSTEGGNITNMDINTTQLTERWAAYFGNISAVISLGDGPGSNTVYSWMWSPPDGGAVCVSTNSSLGLFTAYPAYGFDIDTAWGFAPATTDSGTNTFNATNCTLGIGGEMISNASVADTGPPGGFQTCAIKSSAIPTKPEMVFCSPIIDGGIAWNGQSVDYEIIVPTPDATGATETYYFYANLN